MSTDTNDKLTKQALDKSLSNLLVALDSLISDNSENKDEKLQHLQDIKQQVLELNDVFNANLGITLIEDISSSNVILKALDSFYKDVYIKNLSSLESFITFLSSNSDEVDYLKTDLSTDLAKLSSAITELSTLATDKTKILDDLATDKTKILDDLSTDKTKLLDDLISDKTKLLDDLITDKTKELNDLKNNKSNNYILVSTPKITCDDYIISNTPKVIKIEAHSLLEKDENIKIEKIFFDWGDNSTQTLDIADSYSHTYPSASDGATLTLKFYAIDIYGHTSLVENKTFTYTSNKIPTLTTLAGSFNSMIVGESKDIIFTGATDTDGTISKYEASSNNANLTLVAKNNLGEFTISANTFNIGTDVTITVVALDDKGLKSIPATFTIRVIVSTLQVVNLLNIDSSKILGVYNLDTNANNLFGSSATQHNMNFINNKWVISGDTQYFDIDMTANKPFTISLMYSQSSNSGSCSTITERDWSGGNYIAGKTDHNIMGISDNKLHIGTIQDIYSYGNTIMSLDTLYSIVFTSDGNGLMKGYLGGTLDLLKNNYPLTYPQITRIGSDNNSINNGFTIKQVRLFEDFEATPAQVLVLAKERELLV